MHVQTMEKLMESLNEASLAHKNSIEGGRLLMFGFRSRVNQDKLTCQDPSEAKAKYRRLGMELLRLITGNATADDDDDGCVNEDGAWCWKDDCRGM